MPSALDAIAGAAGYSRYHFARAFRGAYGETPGRVVTVSSDVHRRVREIPWDDLHGAGRYDAMRGYGLSKLLNVLFTYELARRLDGTGVTANCLTPGIVNTGLGREATGAMRVAFALLRPFVKSPDKGAETSVHLATSPDLADASGA